MVKGLIKIGQKEQINQLFTQGHVYMNSLDYFRKCEGMSHDQNEGARDVISGKNRKFVIFPQNGAPAPIEGVISLQATSMEDLKKNVYCTHAVLENEPPLDLENFKRGQYALVIENFSKFLQTLEEIKSKQNLNLSYQLVEYVDRNSYHGELGAFRKYKEYREYEYEKEKEFRILLKPGVGKPFSLYLGSLEDIAFIVEANEVPKILKQKFNL